MKRVRRRAGVGPSLTQRRLRAMLAAVSRELAEGAPSDGLRWRDYEMARDWIVDAIAKRAREADRLRDCNRARRQA